MPWVNKKEKFTEYVVRLEPLGITVCSKAYINCSTPLQMRCKNNHYFERTSMEIDRRIKINSLCDRCPKDEQIFKLNTYIESKQGKLLTEFVNLVTPVTIKCSVVDHPSWKIPPERLLSKKSWCFACRNKIISEIHLKKSKHSIHTLKKLAKDRKGLLLSNSYKGVNKKYLWKCELGHTWKATGSSVINMGSWCSICARGAYEEICREIFEIAFQEDFPKKKPKWLVSEKNTRLELDGYSEKLQIAFEYNGMQHYKNIFNITKEEFDALKKNDARKVKLCEENGVVLLVIPPLVTLGSSIEILKEFIIKTAKTKKLPVVKEEIELVRQYTPTTVKRWKELQRIAEKRDGMLISTTYFDSQTKLTWYCNKHQNTWQARPNDIKNGNWCPKCGGNLPKGKEWLKEIEKKYNGKCLDLENSKFIYKNVNIKLRWRCSNKEHPLIITRPSRITYRDYLCFKCEK